MWFPWGQIKVNLQTNADFFLPLYIVLLSLVMSDAHSTFLHKCHIPFFGGSSAAGKEALLPCTHTGLHKLM